MFRARLSFIVPLLLTCCVLPRATECFAEAACAAGPAKELTPAEQAYKDARYEKAESLFVQALALDPSDANLNASLVHTLLHENRVDDASGRVAKALEDHPQPAELLTASAEVQLRQGHPWLAAQSLDRATAADPCYARIHLIRSRIYRIDSMYASERAELVTAYQLDPADADIWHTWLQIIRPAKEIEGINESLRTMPDLDTDTRDKAIASARAMRLLLKENSQTCQEAALSAPVTFPLIASRASVKEVNAYKLRVDLPKSSVRLLLDTAASGLYISRAAADANSFLHDDADPPGTVRAATIRVGSLELHDCLVGVSDGPFSDGGEGFIGTDVFADNMITLDFPMARLELAPFPESPGGATISLPGDRPNALLRQGFSPVFRRNQFLLVPVMLNKVERQLFVLDTGVRTTTMTPSAAHAVSNTRINFTNTLKTVSGGSLQVYRDSFDFQFANMAMDSQKQIIEFDPSALNANTGIEVAGLLGFNILQNLSIQLDYRDGVVKFTTPASGPARTSVAANAAAPSSVDAPDPTEACNRYPGQDVDRPTDSMVEAAVVGGMDSAKLKTGQSVTVRILRNWDSAVCTLRTGSHLYGRVMAATSSKAADPSSLSLVFDHGDCAGHPNQALLVRLIGLAGGDAQYRAIHNDLPTEVQGGGRSISVAAANQGNLDYNSLGTELAPGSIHPGSVSGLPHLKLTPEGGPQCAALLTSEERSVRLEGGTELIMTMQQLDPP